MTDARLGRIATSAGVTGDPDARLGRIATSAGVTGDPDARLGRIATLAAVTLDGTDALDARVGRVAVLVAVGPPTRNESLTGKRIGLIRKGRL